MSVVYLNEEQIETLEAVADRIAFFGHESDALLLRELVQHENQ